MQKFKMLDNFLQGAYYQTVFDNFDSDEKIWKHYISHLDKEDINQLVQDINNLLFQSKESIFTYVKESNSRYFTNSEEVIYFFKKFLNYISVL